MAFCCMVIMLWWMNFTEKTRKTVPDPLKRWNIELKDNKFNFDGSKCFLTNWTVTDESSWTRVVFICFNQKDFASAPCLLCEMFDPRLLLTVIEVQLTLSVGDSLQHSRECPEWPAVEGLLCLMFSVTITTSYNFVGYLFIWRGDFEISNFNKITIQQMFMVYCYSLIISLSDSIEIFEFANLRSANN